MTPFRFPTIPLLFQILPYSQSNQTLEILKITLIRPLRLPRTPLNVTKTR